MNLKSTNTYDTAIKEFNRKNTAPKTSNEIGKYIDVQKVYKEIRIGKNEYQTDKSKGLDVRRNDHNGQKK